MRSPILRPVPRKRIPSPVQDMIADEMFAEPEREAREEWSGRILAAITIALWLVLIGEAVLRIGFDVRVLW